ncbi:uncharacterized protein EI97DRAFT_3650 [Westerdykella ornata]|uniref:Uncharacterized protein n=1 Tax=Westerdykella ornata TaxID=318751 RepID=A0A6A6JX35_WESOR|nr:uncharacterized protein EI97DRAFT_3650 [Westerdykella ornata]KAF2280633.1 hypothetical protein EI97DRAFT_3650 [Westerdykella ornata]
MASLRPVMTTVDTITPARRKATGDIRQKGPQPSKAKLSVSAASVFHRHPVKSINTSTSKTGPNGGVVGWPQRGEGNGDVLPGKQNARGSAQHPLAVSFNEATEDYRTAVYNAVASKINETHDALVEQLHSSNILPVEDLDGDYASSSSLNLTRATHLVREIEYLYLPLGTTTLNFTHQGEDGERSTIKMSLDERLTLFEEHVRTEEKETMMLQTQWERVLGEIWNCGVQLLGNERMSELLHSEKDPPLHGEPSLFVPEEGDCPQPPIKEREKDKKRVSFHPCSTEPLPTFLNHPPTAARILPHSPEAPVQEVKSLEGNIDSLGAEQMKELERLAHDQGKWFEAKIKQLVAVWKAEI